MDGDTRSRSRVLILVAVAVVVGLAVFASVVLLGDDSDPPRSGPAPTSALPTTTVVPARGDDDHCVAVPDPHHGRHRPVPSHRQRSRLGAAAWPPGPLPPAPATTPSPASCSANSSTWSTTRRSEAPPPKSAASRETQAPAGPRSKGCPRLAGGRPMPIPVRSVAVKTVVLGERPASRGLPPASASPGSGRVRPGLGGRLPRGADGPCLARLPRQPPGRAPRAPAPGRRGWSVPARSTSGTLTTSECLIGDTTGACPPRSGSRPRPSWSRPSPRTTRRGPSSTSTPGTTSTRSAPPIPWSGASLVRSHGRGGYTETATSRVLGERPVAELTGQIEWPTST